MKTKKEKVIVLPYDRAWKADFEKIRAEIENAAGDLIERIEHVGSTAVEGMKAKPIIDIDVVIRDHSVFANLVQKLASIGYEHEGGFGIKDREAFRYADKSHLRAHHLYVCTVKSEELRRHITFRNYLRSHPEAARKYSAAKEQAALVYPDDIGAYIACKSPVIEELYRLCGLK